MNNSSNGTQNITYWDYGVLCLLLNVPVLLEIPNPDKTKHDWIDLDIELKNVDNDLDDMKSCSYFLWYPTDTTMIDGKLYYTHFKLDWILYDVESNLNLSLDYRQFNAPFYILTHEKIVQYKDIPKDNNITIIDQLIFENQDKFAKLKAGNKGMYGFFIGQAKQKDHRVDPKVITEYLNEKIKR